MCLIQHQTGIVPEAGGNGVLLLLPEQKQIFPLIGLVKGVVHLTPPGYPVKKGRGLHGDAACSAAVVHKLGHRLPALWGFMGCAFLLEFAASRPAYMGQHPGGQLACVDDQRDCAPGNFFFRQ